MTFFKRMLVTSDLFIFIQEKARKKIIHVMKLFKTLFFALNGSGVKAPLKDKFALFILTSDPLIFIE